MEAQINRVHAAMEKHQCRNLIYTGDIFDRWNSSPELVNFAIKALPKGYGIPGNHDLPEHSLTDIHRSSYGTLVLTGVIENLSPRVPLPVSPILTATGFPEGLYDTRQGHTAEDGIINLAVVHDYCWSEGHRFPGCPEENHAKHHAEQLKKLGYTMGVYGDNHRGFLVNYKGLPPVLNVGGFIRRNSDEKDRQPQMGLIHSNGTIRTEALESNDLWEDSILKLPPEDRKEIEGLMEVLSSLKAETIDYGDAIRQRIKHKPISGTIRRLLLRSISS